MVSDKKTNLVTIAIAFTGVVANLAYKTKTKKSDIIFAVNYRPVSLTGKHPELF